MFVTAGSRAQRKRAASGAAGGDLTGSYPSPTIAKIGGQTISLADAFSTSGAYAITLTATGTTNITLPASGTLMVNPMTTAGDIIFGGVSGAVTRLAAASNGDVLTLVSGSPAWQPPTGGGNVSNVDTPTNGQIAQWTGATTIQGLATTGSGNAVLATSPTLTTPNIGAATATTPAAGDSSTNVATTAFVTPALAALRVGFANKFRNGTMDIWQRGAAARTVTTAGAYTADGWIVLPTGASVTAERAAGRALTQYSLKVTGAASVTDVIIKQRIEGASSAPMTSQSITVQAYVYNATGGAITPTLTVKHANAADNWTASTTDVNAVSLQSCADTAWTQVAYTFADAGAAANGLEISFDFGNNFSTSGKSIQITELDIRVTPNVSTGINSAPPAPELRPVHSELHFCQRYYQTSYDNGVAPATATHNGMVGLNGVSSASVTNFGVTFQTPMRAAPTLSYWDGAGTANKSSYNNGSGWTDGGTALNSFTYTSTRGFAMLWNVSNTNNFIHYAATAEL